MKRNGFTVIIVQDDEGGAVRDGWMFLEEGDASVEGALARAPLEDRGSLTLWIRDKMGELDLRKSDVVRRSRLNQTFAYQIIAGTRNPSRDKLLQLAFGLGLSVDETCDLLERGGMSALVPAVRRDVIIAFCLHHGLDLSSCDDLLWGLDEATFVAADGHVAG